MCGRYSLSAPHQEIVHHMVEYPDLDVSDADWIDEENFYPRYNIAPRSNAPVIRRQEDDNSLVIHTMKWGVVPHWSKHDDLKLNTINARAENLIEPGGMWASIKAKKRCVVVCDGYFEWLKKGKDRLPHFIRRKDSRLMILAGLFDSAMLEGTSAPLWTFTVVTSDAAPSFTWLHDRQPVILSTTKDFESWLDTSKGWHSGLAELLKPGDGSDLECYPVPKEVGKVGANSPSFIQPVSQRKDGIGAMFAKQAAKGKQGNATSSAKPPDNGLSQTVEDDSSMATSKDVKAPKREIEPDSSPLPLASGDQPSPKKQKLDHVRDGPTKRPNDEEDNEFPNKKQARMSQASSQSPRPTTPQQSKEFANGRQSRTQAELGSQSRRRGIFKTPSPKKTPKSMDGADKGSTKITSFFRPKT